MKLHLVDNNTSTFEALRTAFATFPEVDVVNGDLLELAFDTVVSPANSSGFMDGGIDDAYRRAFGHSFEAAVRDRASSLPAGLPVGTAILLHVEHVRIKHVVVAPTMEFPDSVPPLNARRALAAALRCAGEANVGDLFCPGLCTGVGLADPKEASTQMVAAFQRWRGP